MNYSDTLNNLPNSIKDTQIESSDSRFRSDYFYLNKNNTNDCAVGISLEERKAKIGVF